MEDKNEKNKEEGEQTNSDSNEGDKPKESSLVDDTNLASKRLEEATKKAKEERLAREASYSKMKLGGESEAGKEEVKKEETPKEYRDRIDKEINEGQHGD